MAAGWSDEETRTLLGIRGVEDMQSQLDKVVSKRTIYQKISLALAEFGFIHMRQQCRTKKKPSFRGTRR